MRTLLVLAHPDLAASRVNAALAEAARPVENVTLHDLYATYPDLRIDVEREQRLLLEHDRIVLQFPFYWYSAPPLLKKWLDEVFLRGFAYGSGGTSLSGKSLLIATSTGSTEEQYGPGGAHPYPVVDLLNSFDATANITGMRYEEPLIVHGTHGLGDAELAAYQDRYRELLASGVLRKRALSAA
ncbi:NAD(P)H-dependent oxidoreductase [Streptomyces iranensis]|uniref:Glutathione-regulated potassium-efflux system ancillary protein KefG n=1 Tax=Streptomyces iranensis TaxID=576784 RepID=A0A060ZU91_9ACTN|nr:NAD(P)H-dependent oxidoreductase [Streptomyces iranensis]MBP2064016.1 glutathione-regulated potassium-efflux system ancillary protein KefG [Streptomyces iranensis]CDR06582.1 NAD(P)H dehydrogenase (quinone) [Streptomyces iranensis]